MAASTSTIDDAAASNDELSASSCDAALNGGYVDKRDAFVSAEKGRKSSEDLLIGMCCSIKGSGVMQKVYRTMSPEREIIAGAAWQECLRERRRR